MCYIQQSHNLDHSVLMHRASVACILSSGQGRGKSCMLLSTLKMEIKANILVLIIHNRFLDKKKLFSSHLLKVRSAELMVLLIFRRRCQLSLQITTPSLVLIGSFWFFTRETRHIVLSSNKTGTSKFHLEFQPDFFETLLPHQLLDY